MQNRAERRGNRRRLLAALRAEGCRCSPTITTDRFPEAVVPGARETGTVRHEPGCPLDQRLTLAALAGRRPMLVVDGVRGCER